MKQITSLSICSLLLITMYATLPATSAAQATIVFYGGDFDPNNPNANGLSNENDAIVHGGAYSAGKTQPIYGAATYQNFIYEPDECWPSGCYITNLFTNNLSDLNPTSAYWEIRAGVSEGNAGTLVASGVASGQYRFSHKATGRSGFGFNEYRDEVCGLYLTVDPGTQYWFAVVPNDPKRPSRSYNSNTFGLNSVGTQISNEQFWNSAYCGVNFTNANNAGVFPTFSSGVVDNLVRGKDSQVPEPSSLMLLGSAALVAMGVARRLLA